MATEGKNKEQAILEAAEQEFILKGYAAAKTTAIAAAAGVTHAMLHYYFRTKENLFNQVFEQKARLLSESVLPLFYQKDLPFTERLKAGIEAHFDFLRANPALPRFVMNELIAQPERRHIMLSTFHKIGLAQKIGMLKAELEEEIARGRIAPVDPMQLILDVLSLNLFVFIVMPVSEILSENVFPNKDTFLDARRKENVEIIMKRLKKQ